MCGYGYPVGRSTRRVATSGGASPCHGVAVTCRLRPTPRLSSHCAPTAGGPTIAEARCVGADVEHGGKAPDPDLICRASHAWIVAGASQRPKRDHATRV